MQSDRTDQHARTDRQRVFVYRGTLPLAIVMLFIAPLLFASIAALLAVGGTLAAFMLPAWLRRKRVRRQDADVITLPPDQYSRIDPDGPRLPRQ